MRGSFFQLLAVLREQNEDFFVRSVGTSLQPTGCINIGNVLVENMPAEQLLSIQCFKSHRIFNSKPVSVSLCTRASAFTAYQVEHSSQLRFTLPFLLQLQF